MLSFKWDAFPLADFDDSSWSTRNEPGGILLNNPTRVDDVKSVDVFDRVYAVECGLFIEL